jgi:hypothetical protein
MKMPKKPKEADIKVIPKISLLGTALSLFFSGSLAADNSTAFNHGWCLGRSTLILYSSPNHSIAQDIYFSSKKRFVLNGLSKFGATTKNRNYLLETIAEVEQRVLNEARAFVAGNGIEALRRDIDTIYLPEMLRRCAH